MNILVVGGAGFIGRNLCKRLLDQGHLVDCIDDFSSGNMKAMQEELNPHPHFCFCGWNMAKIPSYGLVMANYDVIFNLACITDPALVKQNQAAVMRAGLDVRSLCDFANSKGAKLIQISSIRVHEDVDDIYIHSKRYAENTIKESAADYLILRLNSTFGPGMSATDSRVIPQFIRAALAGEDIVIWGDGLSVDTFTYIDNMTRALDSCMDESGIYNLGSRNGININELAGMIDWLCGGKSKIVHNDLKIVQHYDRSAPPGNYRNLAEFTDLQTGLQLTINYFKEKMNDDAEI